MSLTKTDKYILNILAETYDSDENLPLTEFSEKYSVSKAAVTKATKKFGYSGYKEYYILNSIDERRVSYTAVELYILLCGIVAEIESSCESKMNKLSDIRKELYTITQSELTVELIKELGNILYLTDAIILVDSEAGRSKLLNKLLSKELTLVNANK